MATVWQAGVWPPREAFFFFVPQTGFGADILFSSKCLPLQVEGQNLKPISFEWHKLEYVELELCMPCVHLWDGIVGTS